MIFKSKVWHKKLRRYLVNPHIDYRDCVVHEKKQHYKMSDVYICEPTGFEDKNGTPIYYGDIVKRPSTYKRADPWWTGVVSWVGGEICIKRDGRNYNIDNYSKDIVVVKNTCEDRK